MLKADIPLIHILLLSNAHHHPYNLWVTASTLRCIFRRSARSF